MHSVISRRFTRLKLAAFSSGGDVCDDAEVRHSYLLVVLCARGKEELSVLVNNSLLNRNRLRKCPKAQLVTSQTSRQMFLKPDEALWCAQVVRPSVE